MRITILCTSADHPVNSHLKQWIYRSQSAHDITLARTRQELVGGDLLFLISCAEIVTREERARFRKVLVVHASDLPQGRGWSPHVWQILSGAENIRISLLEAEDEVDSGAIWKKLSVSVPKHALSSEIDALIFSAETALMDFAIEAFETIKPEMQGSAVEPTYYRRRTPDDSRVDPSKSIESQFDLIRVCDPQRYPAFFELHGCRYTIRLEKVQ